MKTILKFLLFFLLPAALILGCQDKNPKNVSNTAQESPEIPGSEASKLQNAPLIHPISHATAVIQWDGLTIFLDPVGGPEPFASFEQPDLILITDIHGDHFDLKTLEGLNTERAKIIVPQAVADKIPEKFTPQLDILANGEQKERYGIDVEAIPMYNLREEAKTFHVKGRGNGYILQKAGTRLYISGDTEDIPEMRALKNIDIALICMNLPYTMTVEAAASAVVEFKPKTVYPYHYRGRPDVSDVALFKTLVNEADPEIEVVQLDWYPDAPY